MKTQKINIGFDIGSVSINTVVCDEKGALLHELPYKRHFGRVLELAAEVLSEIEKRFGKDNVIRVAFTGNSAKAIANEVNTYFEIETTAQTRGLFEIMPEARTVIAIGGHDSALLLTTPSPEGFILNDFKLNEACAAGTGSFIDQQAERVFSDVPELNNITDPERRIDAILNCFIEEGEKSDEPAAVACRCTVFTKSDMIHLQNKGIPVKHIIAGLHEGVAKNYKSTLINNRELKAPVAFIGGYSANRLAKVAFEHILGMDVTVPEHNTSIGAYGTVLNAIAKNEGRPVTSDEILALKNAAAFAAQRTAALAIKLRPFAECGTASGLEDSKKATDVYMGYDIGSTTTKLVLITPEGRIVYKRYIPTEGQPVIAIKKALKHCLATIDVSKVNVLGVGTTGSGREVANLFVGADDVVNEVTAHARGTTFFDPGIDTIFELGGQDAKYTSLKDGFVVDFRMNKVCAAGTGSFLEETANKLGIDIAGEYESLALSSQAPYKLTERCTVYMESDLMSYLQMGADVKDLLAGLSQAVVHNYLNRVVQDGKIGERISFQGGPSLNKSVVAAFERITGKPIITLPHREVMGAIGAALHAMDEITQRIESGEKFVSRFRGWDVAEMEFTHEEEICHRNPNCHNQCKLQRYVVGGEEAIYGGECGMYESRQQAKKRTPDYNKVRNGLFMKYMKDLYRIVGDESTPHTEGKIVVGIPRSLSFHQIGILWVNLFYELGFEVLITPETNNEIVNRGIAAMTGEACFPIKISHGHAATLKDKCDYLFLPLMIEMSRDDNKKQNRSFYCPHVESNSFVLGAALSLDPKKVMRPAVYMSHGKDAMTNSFKDDFNRLGLNFNKEQFKKAYAVAKKKLDDFNAEILEVGQKILSNIGKERAIVVVGRPYSSYDSRTNLNLFATFSRLGVHAIPQEFININGISVEEEYPNMYWGFGSKVLRTAKFINESSNLFGLYLTSFSCGPDSFVLHFFNHEMNRTNRPYLELELDEHSAGAGVETRLLAFIDAIKNQSEMTILSNKDVAYIPRRTKPLLQDRILYIPMMTQGVRCLAAAFRHLGIDAHPLPTYTPEGLEFGKKNTSGKECFPCVVTTGDIFNVIEKHRNEGMDVNQKLAFFMPETNGPCRFGQYSRLQRILLNHYHYKDIPILSPNSDDGYSFAGVLKEDQVLKLRQLGWQGVVYSDLLEKALWRIRPYEIEKGSADKVFEEYMQQGIKAIEQGGGKLLTKVARDAAKAFRTIKCEHTEKPLIGIVGEIFVRTHKESNQQLIRHLEDLGCEVYVSSIAEWVEYCSEIDKRFALKRLATNKNLDNAKDVARAYLTTSYQSFKARILTKPFKSLLKGRLDHKTDAILKEVKNTFSNHIRGEAILSIGGSLAFASDGFNGVVNAMPFTCMPSLIASSILKVKMREKAPFVDMVYDGTILPNRDTNLATFVFQAKQHLAKNGRKK